MFDGAIVGFALRLAQLFRDLHHDLRDQISAAFFVEERHALCTDANLFPDEAGFTPRPAWQIIEAARRRYLTGELTLPTAPPTRIFLRDGMVYFAERTSDGALPIRLMMEGVITRS